ncbi:MAG: glycosyl hydrolase 115 family protein, partial [Limisphaerales bacterium]
IWAAREFGPEHATEIAELVAKYAKYNGRRKPELLEPGAFSLVNYGEADRIVAEWQELRDHAEAISAQLVPESRDAFFELVLDPIKACDIVNELYIAAAKNRLFAAQGRAAANDYAAKARELFQADAQLTDYYHHTLAGGKWDRMMSQTHIGYTGWQQPPANIIPALHEVELKTNASLGVAIEGSTAAWPGASEPAELPELDPLSGQRRYIDVFNRGRETFQFEANGSAPWLVLSATRGEVKGEQRIWVSVDWIRVTGGSANGTVKISGAASEPVIVQVRAFNPSVCLLTNLIGFVETDGHVAIEAAHYTACSNTSAAHWECLPDYGRAESAMTVFPVTAPTASPPLDSPCLEYAVELSSTGRVEVALELAPSLNYAPERGAQIAVCFDDAVPRILTIVPKGYVAGDGNRDWEQTVKDSVRVIKSEHVLAAPGAHRLKVWMVDPGVV